MELGQFLFSYKQQAGRSIRARHYNHAGGGANRKLQRGGLNAAGGYTQPSDRERVVVFFGFFLKGRPVEWSKQWPVVSV